MPNPPTSISLVRKWQEPSALPDFQSTGDQMQNLKRAWPSEPRPYPGAPSLQNLPVPSLNFSAQM